MVLWYYGFMKIFSYISLKGGAGKTMSCLATASALNRAGYKVAVLDLDPQASARAWARTAEFPFAVLNPAQAAQTPSGTEWLLVDTPPNSLPILRDTAETSDYIVVPLNAGAQEIDRLRPTMDEIGKTHLKPDCVIGVLPTRIPNSSERKIMPEVLEELGYKVLGLIPEKVDYFRAFGRQFTPELEEPYAVALRALGIL
jgi:chromosome partitioning protein